MKTSIAIELKNFLAETNISQMELSRASGVKAAYINRLKNGVQKDVLSRYADALRDAMRRLTATPATPPGDAGAAEAPPVPQEAQDG